MIKWESLVKSVDNMAINSGSTRRDEQEVFVRVAGQLHAVRMPSTEVHPKTGTPILVLDAS